jgi:ribonuclease HIII
MPGRSSGQLRKLSKLKRIINILLYVRNLLAHQADILNLSEFNDLIEEGINQHLFMLLIFKLLI